MFENVAKDDENSLKGESYPEKGPAQALENFTEEPV